MTIWILALLLLGCLAGIGYAQGAIRVSVSFVGIIVAALSAGPMSKLFKPIVTGVGITSPLLLWVLPPLIAFIVVQILFKVGAFALHRKIDLYYKYRGGDLRLALWERLNARLGACLGLLNALAYLVLISMVIYQFSYWTIQLGTPAGEAQSATDSKVMRLINQMGRDLQKTGLSRVARAVDPLPEVYYDAADLAGLLFQNPLLEARLSRYPAFLSLGEKQQFQAIAEDSAFSQSRLARAPLLEILKNSNVQAITKSQEMITYVWSIISPDLADLRPFLETGISQKYSDPILGRWFFDVKGAMAAYIRENPNTPSSQMLKMRQRIASAYSKTMLVAAPNGEVALKNYPIFKTQGKQTTVDLKNFQGRWKEEGGQYALKLGGAGERKGKVENARLSLDGDPPLAFVPED